MNLAKGDRVGGPRSQSHIFKTLMVRDGQLRSQLGLSAPILFFLPKVTLTHWWHQAGAAKQGHCKIIWFWCIGLKSVNRMNCYLSGTRWRVLLRSMNVVPYKGMAERVTAWMEAPAVFGSLNIQLREAHIDNVNYLFIYPLSRTIYRSGADQSSTGWIHTANSN